MIIKATCITNLTDARYFAAMEARYLGFNLEAGTPGYLDPVYMKAMREWVEGPRITGEFSQTSVANIREAATFYGLDAVQVDAAAYLMHLPQLEGLEVLLRIDASETDASTAKSMLEYARPYISHIFLDATGIGHLSEAWADICRQFPVIVHALGNAAETNAMIARLQPAGISISGGEEERTGVKSFEEIEEILDNLKS